MSDLPRAKRAAVTVLPTRHGQFGMYGFWVDGVELVALTVGLDGPPSGLVPWVRVHSECLTGDALGSLRCDCGEQLQAALGAIMEHGYGAVVYARGHEGRGIGLVEKLKAYALQDAGLDTLDANLALGHPADARRYDQAAAVLVDLGLTRIALLSSNPAKEEALAAYGIEVVSRLRVGVPDRPENVFYLNTKRERMRHDSEPTEVIPVAWDAHSAIYDGVRALGPAWVIGQMGQSLDGFIASRTGDGHALTGREDHRHLHRLRSLADAVVVGAATVVADDPRLTVREVAGRSPVRVIVDPRGVVPTSAVALSDGEVATLWLVGDGVEVPSVPAHVEVVRVPGEGPFAPSVIVKLLAERGLGRVFVEGGGRLVSSFVASGQCDRLFVTISPVLIGDGVPGIRFAGADSLGDAVRARSQTFRLGDDVCMMLDFTGPMN